MRPIDYKHQARGLDTKFGGRCEARPPRPGDDWIWCEGCREWKPPELMLIDRDECGRCASMGYSTGGK